MESLPEPEKRPLAWRAPFLAAAAALGVGLIGFNLFTGLSVFDILVALNDFFGQAVARLTPAAAKSIKVAGIVLKVVGDILTAALSGLTTILRLLGPQGVLITGLVILLATLAVIGARRFLNQGEQS